MTAVLGAGMSGLSAAFYALKYPKLGNIVVLEASSRVGGWIRSHQSPSGIIYEKGPRTVRVRGPLGKCALELIGKLQLTDKLCLNEQNRITELLREDLMTRAENERWAAWGLQGGLEQLPQNLANHLCMHEVDIKMEHKCEKIYFKPNCVELVVNGETKKYNRVISSLPAKNLADLLTEQHCRLSEELRAIPTVTVAVVNLQFDGDILPQKSFGVLVPPKEKLPVLGIIFDTHTISQNSSTVLTVMMGGAWFNTYFGNSPSEEHLLNVAVEHVKRMLRIQVDPVDSDISILKDCIAQYVVEFHSHCVAPLTLA
ncbi:hypothetical protein KM043_007174 [Ampulex compressa]|nr:hypothetical protein KM043_007174 [Ampulex compressa]